MNDQVGVARGLELLWSDFSLKYSGVWGVMVRSWVLPVIFNILLNLQSKKIAQNPFRACIQGILW